MGRLVSIEEVKGYTGHKRSDDDQVLGAMTTGLERAVERYCRRRFSPEPLLADGEDTAPPVTKTFATRGRSTVPLPDLRAVTSVSLGGAALVLANDDYSLSAPNPEEPYTLLELGYYSRSMRNLSPSTRDLSITGRWGFNPTPDDVKHLVCSIVARSWKKKDANFSDMIQQGPEGALMRYFRSLPEELKMIADSYRITRLAVV